MVAFSAKNQPFSGNASAIKIIGEIRMIQAFIDYCIANPILTAILVGLVVFIAILASIVLYLSAKANKAKETLAMQAAQERNLPLIQETAEDKKTKTPVVPVEELEEVEAIEEETKEVEHIEEVVEEQPTEKTEDVSTNTAEMTTEEVIESIPEETAKELIEETAQEPEQKANEDIPTTATEKAPTPEKKKQKTTKAIKTTTKSKEKEMLLDELKDVDTSIDFYEEDETDRVTRYSGKWVICRVITDDKQSQEEETYFFELHASNGEKLLSSEEYTTYNGALRGIETHKTNILRDNFKIALSKKGDYIFKLLSGKNLLLCTGENYSTRAGCESAIESVKRFAKTAIVDENIQDHIVKVPLEDESDIQPLPDGYNGKWLLSRGEDVNGNPIYYFELYANNGEKLLSSEEYTTYVGAVNGIQTHKSNIAENNFRVTLTKRGDYIYKLLNRNGQLLCLGEHYRTKRLCLNAVESVRRFAMYSPVLTDEKNTK